MSAVLLILFGAGAMFCGCCVIADARRFLRHPSLRNWSDVALYVLGTLSVFGGVYLVGLSL